MKTKLVKVDRVERAIGYPAIFRENSCGHIWLQLNANGDCVLLHHGKGHDICGLVFGGAPRDGTFGATDYTRLTGKVVIEFNCDE